MPMSGVPEVESLDAFHRFVLLAVTELEQAGDTPAPSYAVREQAAARVDDLDAEFVGGVTREKVIKALSMLEADALLEQETEDAQPTGKGRPKHRLVHDAETVLDALADDDRVGSYATRLRA